MANHSYKHSKKQQDPIEVRIVVGFLKGLIWLVMLPFKGLTGTSSAKPGKRKAGAVDIEQVSRQWADIQTSIGLGGATHFGSAVVSADKLLDHVLKQKGYPGETMGERLKASRDDVSPAVYHNIWEAHKLRNRLVHEVDQQVMSYEAKDAIKAFEAMLRELRALK